MRPISATGTILTASLVLELWLAAMMAMMVARVWFVGWFAAAKKAYVV
jgi:hypothetical protein